MSDNWLDGFGADRKVARNNDDGVSADAEFLAAVEVIQERDCRVEGSEIKGWLLTTDRERVNATPDNQIIWAKTVADLEKALDERYPSPSGFTRVVHRPHGFAYNLRHLGYLIGAGQARPVLEITFAEYITAAQTGMTVGVGRRVSFLKSAGYSDDEAAFLIYNSRVGDIPIGIDLVVNPQGELRQDKKAHAKATRALERSRRARARGDNPTGVRAKPISAAAFRFFLHEAHTALRDRRELPRWILFDITCKRKTNLQRRLLDMVAFWHRLARNKAYRKLKSYREILTHMAVAKNMKASVKEGRTKYSVTVGSGPGTGYDAYADFLEWVKGELLWAKGRRLAFLKSKIKPEKDFLEREKDKP